MAKSHSPRDGRPPKPVPLKVLEGGLSAEAAARGAPSVTPEKPRCPTWLSDYAKTTWRRIVPELDALGLLTLVDRDTLAILCESVAQFRIATETMQRGQLTTGQRGEARKNPAWQIWRDSAKMISQFSAMFGLSPSDRARLFSDPQGGTAGPSLEEILGA